MSDLEILAPAGSMESLTAAVRSGANAVYLGGKLFSARGNAVNFDAEELRRAVEYCHARGVKVYQTVNTLVRDDELEKTQQCIKEACNAGVDALIIQDLGVARIAHEIAPDMALHASTQMTAVTPAAMRALEELGFKRAVLPREMNFAEIREIADNTSLELEMFVHGALCMCVSGQCYLSAMLGSRSGNRGLCAQPCRLPFGVQGGNGHDLSLKDLSLVDKIPELHKAGVTSFKIEGRMKRPEYVAAAVTSCRKAAEGVSDDDINNKLRAVFSRSGFTDGYLTENRGREMFGIRGKEDVTAAAPVLSSLKHLYDKETPLVPVDFAFTALEGETATLAASAGGKNAFAESECIVEKAQNKPTTEEELNRQLQKCGGTFFYCRSADIEIDDNIRLPLSAVNALRRDVLSSLENSLSKVKPIPCGSFKKNFASHLSKQPKFYARFDSVNQIPDDLSGISLIYFPAMASLSDWEKLLKRGLPLAAELPRGMFGREEKVRERLLKLKEMGVETVCGGHIGAVRLGFELGFIVHGGVGMNVFNTIDLQELEDMGVEEAMVSFELTVQQMQRLGGDLPRSAIAYGYVPLMLTRNCPVKNGKTCKTCGRKSVITDRMGISFPVYCDGNCSEILNSRPIYMAERLNEMRNIDSLVLYFTIETREQVSQIINDYKEKSAPNGSFTRGLYYRGVE